MIANDLATSPFRGAITLKNHHELLYGLLINTLSTLIRNRKEKAMERRIGGEKGGL